MLPFSQIKPSLLMYWQIKRLIREKYNLSAKSTPEQLSKHASELGTSLPNWKAHKSVKEALTRCKFSKEQLEALVPNQRKCNSKLTIEERAKYCVKTGDFIDIVANHWCLGPKNKDENKIIASVSHQSKFCVKLAEGGVDPVIIEVFAKDKDLI
ncbi:hypothetical protein GLOIN_2v1475459 [Rhizophagus clarus]|uniref:Uncharacterized protein n=1 Tax=Rhizophagus clarus TaxID=94130 RepID=A0A8H3KRV3_9GLOM|nr:hypothetical protein GLOIN_2v1475459 [Rhizophagus clarus]